MRETPTSKPGFSSPRVILSFVFCSIGVLSALMAAAVYAGATVLDEPLKGLPGAPDAWSAGPNLPSPTVRAVGIYLPANGRFYVMGGRSADTAGTDLTHPFEYNPATNTWAIKVATYPDNQVSNMACGVLTVDGTGQIYCVGGSAAGATTATARVFSYDPVTDTIATLPTADDWPGDASGFVLPGGFAVAGNKLHIIGGFRLSTNMTAQTWLFDPTAAVGARWLQSANYPVARGFIPATTIAGFIYTAGGTSTDGTTLTDTANSFRYDPASNVWDPIANIPRATGETRAVTTINGEMVVLGGGRTAPNPSNKVYGYDPAISVWSQDISFITARRNFPADSDGSRVWLAGGYDNAGTPLNTMEIAGSPPPAPLAMTAAVSRKAHGSAASFDLNLALSGTPGVEPRIGGASGEHTLVITFNNTLVSGNATVTGGTGSMAGAAAFSGNNMTISLTGVANAQTVTVTLSNVTDSFGQVLANTNFSASFLLADTNGDGFVIAGDALQTRNRSGQATDAANFRSDVNVDGFVNSGDTTVVRSRSGTALP
jgi:N-acetylneuraminic acid mutarotase